nr:hypothetical protein [Salmonella enterica subsp. enterica serovar Weltevreden]
MCHSFLIVYYWNDTEFLTLPQQYAKEIQAIYVAIKINILRHSRRFF